MDKGIPDFSREGWYLDPSDHRCPHDAWLEQLIVHEPASGARSENRLTRIETKLLGAYHDGWIVFRYEGVSSYSVAAEVARQGVGDWLSDTFRIAANGGVTHEIHWERAKWLITAEAVTYEWWPKA